MRTPEDSKQGKGLRTQCLCVVLSKPETTLKRYPCLLINKRFRDNDLIPSPKFSLSHTSQRCSSGALESDPILTSGLVPLRLHPPKVLSGVEQRKSDSIINSNPSFSSRLLHPHTPPFAATLTTCSTISTGNLRSVSTPNGSCNMCERWWCLLFTALLFFSGDADGDNEGGDHLQIPWTSRTSSPRDAQCLCG